jgi:YbbR domain-containing protein
MAVSPRQVRILAKIDKIAERQLKHIPIGAVSVPHGRRVKLEPSVIRVTLQGASGRLAILTPDSIDAYIDISKWKPQEKNYTPEFNLPPGLVLVETVPEQVRVRMEVR